MNVIALPTTQDNERMDTVCYVRRYVHLSQPLQLNSRLIVVETWTVPACGGGRGGGRGGEGQEEGRREEEGRGE